MKILNDLKFLFSPYVGPSLIKGLAVIVVHNSNSLIICHGSSNAKLKTPMLDNTYFEIASITKTFVGILVSKMVLENKLSLDSKLSLYFTVVPEAQDVSILELMTHTSGLPRLPSNLKPTNPMNPYQDYSYNDLTNELKQVEIGQKQYLYSNLGFAILGKIIEKIYGDTFSNVLRKEVLIPLELSDMSFSNDSRPIPLTSVHSSHFPNVEPWVLGEFEAAGGLRANILQMQKYLMANILPEKTPLKEAILFSHTIFHQADEFRVAMAWHQENMSGNYFHEGGTYGSSSLIEFNPGSKTGIVILSNTYTSFEEFGPAIESAYKLFEK
ncbi:serine hydrolase domain-containing protein [Peredibacter starrii]|uniref:Serine hydrolase domain-containing protein n=1 Tax=Peredibacter starrii TaxID=28202 RepID=A0AAX4HK00_9BACT|nr:serine hydrolase domain-containing protein [Peredibacter starrii]WPU63575.1 serine hydrolase domain-containing protein [Peredibacter starrii]